MRHRSRPLERGAWAHAWIPAGVWAALVGVSLFGCASFQRGDESSSEVSLVQLGQHLADYVDRTVLTHGWVAAVGEVPQGVWVTAAASEDAIDRVRTSTNLLALPDGLTLLLPPGTSREFFDEAQAREIELLVRVVDEVGLPDGRRAVRVLPLQVATVQRFD